LPELVFGEQPVGVGFGAGVGVGFGVGALVGGALEVEGWLLAAGVTPPYP
jgi:hypothetical protein